MTKKHLVIFDTTLSEGSKATGTPGSRNDRLAIARKLELMRVDVIDAGFPASSSQSFLSVRDIASEIRDSTVAVQSSCLESDIDAAIAAVKPAKSGRILVFVPTSARLMDKTLRTTAEGVIAATSAAVRQARNEIEQVGLSCGDAICADPDFLCRIIEAAISAGASSISIPDPTGSCLPSSYAAIFSSLVQRIPNSHRAVWSTNCHNDLGLAVANSLAAITAGATQAECSVNGIGPGAGCAALEEIVMAVKTRSDFFQCESSVETTGILSLSRLVSQAFGTPVQPNKAIVGDNAFAHASGIHQDGVIKHPETYEIMKASDVGWESNKIILGKHSGRAAMAIGLAKIGVKIQDRATLDIVFARFKELADSKAVISDEDLRSISSD